MLNRLWVAAAILLAAVLAWSGRATSQAAFPDEPGRDTLMLVCTQCHSPAKILLADYSREDWQFIVYDMIARGAPLHQEDIAVLTKYLQDNYANDK